MIPGAQRMERRAIHESLAFGSGLIVAVEEPLIAGHANLKQHAVVSICASPGILLAQVKPALLALATIGPEDRLEGKRLCARKRVVVDEQCILHSIELHSLANRGIDDSGRAQYDRFVSANI